jgi:U2 small nuclear ribonucleoprotein A'
VYQDWGGGWEVEGQDADGNKHYRYWVLWRCPTVRFLDYQKVKDAEREKAKELFGSAEAPTELASRVSGLWV